MASPSNICRSDFIFRPASASQVVCLSFDIPYHRILLSVLDIQVWKDILLKICIDVATRALPCCQILTCTTWSECAKPSVLQRLHSLSQSQLLLPSMAAVNGPQSLYSQVSDLHAQSLCSSETIVFSQTEILNSDIIRRSTTLK